MVRLEVERPILYLEVEYGEWALNCFSYIFDFVPTVLTSNRAFLLYECRGDDEGAGLIQRSLRDLFSKITISQAEAATAGFDEGGDMPPVTSKTTFKGSFFEIFNERVYDLLSSDNLEKTLAVREDSNGVYVEGLKEIEVGNTVEAENLFARGLENRHVASTNMNRTSSRSHAVFFLSVKTEHTTSDGIRKVRNSKFTLVDLAGSERQKSTGE
jgi:hypothetical protein